MAASMRRVTWSLSMALLLVVGSVQPCGALQGPDVDVAWPARSTPDVMVVGAPFAFAPASVPHSSVWERYAFPNATEAKNSSGVATFSSLSRAFYAASTAASDGPAPSTPAMRSAAQSNPGAVTLETLGGHREPSSSSSSASADTPASVLFTITRVAVSLSRYQPGSFAGASEAELSEVPTNTTGNDAAFASAAVLEDPTLQAMQQLNAAAQRTRAAKKRLLMAFLTRTTSSDSVTAASLSLCASSNGGQPARPFASVPTESESKSGQGDGFAASAQERGLLPRSLWNATRHVREFWLRAAEFNGATAPASSEIEKGSAVLDSVKAHAEWNSAATRTDASGSASAGPMPTTAPVGVSATLPRGLDASQVIDGRNSAVAFFASSDEATGKSVQDVLGRDAEEVNAAGQDLGGSGVDPALRGEWLPATQIKRALRRVLWSGLDGYFLNETAAKSEAASALSTAPNVFEFFDSFGRVEPLPWNGTASLNLTVEEFDAVRETAAALPLSLLDSTAEVAVCGPLGFGHFVGPSAAPWIAVQQQMEGTAADIRSKKAAGSKDGGTTTPHVAAAAIATEHRAMRAEAASSSSATESPSTANAALETAIADTESMQSFSAFMESAVSRRNDDDSASDSTSTALSPGRAWRTTQRQFPPRVNPASVTDAPTPAPGTSAPAPSGSASSSSQSSGPSSAASAGGSSGSSSSRSAMAASNLTSDSDDDGDSSSVSGTGRRVLQRAEEAVEPPRGDEATARGFSAQSVPAMGTLSNLGLDVALDEQSYARLMEDMRRCAEYTGRMAEAVADRILEQYEATAVQERFPFAAQQVASAAKASSSAAAGTSSTSADTDPYTVSFLQFAADFLASTRPHPYRCVVVARTTFAVNVTRAPSAADSVVQTAPPAVSWPTGPSDAAAPPSGSPRSLEVQAGGYTARIDAIPSGAAHDVVMVTAGAATTADLREDSPWCQGDHTGRPVEARLKAHADLPPFDIVATDSDGNPSAAGPSSAGASSDSSEGQAGGVTVPVVKGTATLYRAAVLANGTNASSSDVGGNNASDAQEWQVLVTYKTPEDPQLRYAHVTSLDAVVSPSQLWSHVPLAPSASPRDGSNTTKAPWELLLDQRYATQSTAVANGVFGTHSSSGGTGTATAASHMALPRVSWAVAVQTVAGSGDDNGPRAAALGSITPWIPVEMTAPSSSAATSSAASWRGIHVPLGRPSSLSLTAASGDPSLDALSTLRSDPTFVASVHSTETWSDDSLSPGSTRLSSSQATLMRAEKGMASLSPRERLLFAKWKTEAFLTEATTHSVIGHVSVHVQGLATGPRLQQCPSFLLRGPAASADGVLQHRRTAEDISALTGAAASSSSSGATVFVVPSQGMTLRPPRDPSVAMVAPLRRTAGVVRVGGSAVGAFEKAQGSQRWADTAVRQQNAAAFTALASLRAPTETDAESAVQFDDIGASVGASAAERAAQTAMDDRIGGGLASSSWASGTAYEIAIRVGTPAIVELHWGTADVRPPWLEPRAVKPQGSQRLQAFADSTVTMARADTFAFERGAPGGGSGIRRGPTAAGSLPYCAKEGGMFPCVECATNRSDLVVSGVNFTLASTAAASMAAAAAGPGQVGHLVTAAGDIQTAAAIANSDTLSLTATYLRVAPSVTDASATPSAFRGATPAPDDDPSPNDAVQSSLGVELICRVVYETDATASSARSDSGSVGGPSHGVPVFGTGTYRLTQAGDFECYTAATKTEGFETLLSAAAVRDVESVFRNTNLEQLPLTTVRLHLAPLRPDGFLEDAAASAFTAAGSSAAPDTTSGVFGFPTAQTTALHSLSELEEWLLLPRSGYADIPLGVLAVVGFGSTYSGTSTLDITVRTPICETAKTDALRARLTEWLFRVADNSTMFYKNLNPVEFQATPDTTDAHVCFGKDIAKQEFVQPSCCGRNGVCSSLNTPYAFLLVVGAGVFGILTAVASAVYIYNVLQEHRSVRLPPKFKLDVRDKSKIFTAHLLAPTVLIAHSYFTFQVDNTTGLIFRVSDLVIIVVWYVVCVLRVVAPLLRVTPSIYFTWSCVVAVVSLSLLGNAVVWCAASLHLNMSLLPYCVVYVLIILQLFWSVYWAKTNLGPSLILRTRPTHSIVAVDATLAIEYFAIVLLLGLFALSTTTLTPFLAVLAACLFTVLFFLYNFSIVSEVAEAVGEQVTQLREEIDSHGGASAALRRLVAIVKGEQPRRRSSQSGGESDNAGLLNQTFAGAGYSSDTDDADEIWKFQKAVSRSASGRKAGTAKRAAKEAQSRRASNPWDNSVDGLSAPFVHSEGSSGTQSRSTTPRAHDDPFHRRPTKAQRRGRNGKHDEPEATRPRSQTTAETMGELAETALNAIGMPLLQRTKSTIGGDTNGNNGRDGGGFGSGVFGQRSPRRGGRSNKHRSRHDVDDARSGTGTYAPPSPMPTSGFAHGAMGLDGGLDMPPMVTSGAAHMAPPSRSGKDRRRHHPAMEEASPLQGSAEAQPAEDPFQHLLPAGASPAKGSKSSKGNRTLPTQEQLQASGMDHHRGVNAALPLQETAADGFQGPSQEMHHMGLDRHPQHTQRPGGHEERRHGQRHGGDHKGDEEEMTAIALSSALHLDDDSADEGPPELQETFAGAGASRGLPPVKDEDEAEAERLVAQIMADSAV